VEGETGGLLFLTFLRQPLSQCRPGDAEQRRGRGLIPLGTSQRFFYQSIRNLLERGELCRETELIRIRSGSWIRLATQQLTEPGQGQEAPLVATDGFENQGPQLAHVPRKGIVLQ